MTENNDAAANPPITQSQPETHDGVKPEFEFEKYGIGIGLLRDDSEKQLLEFKQNKGIFTIKSAKRWMEESKNRPVPQMLFDEFWFEGEVSILFADTNVGKSILAVQIGNSISRGEAIKGFRLEAAAQPILYFDFELSDKQFENRYSANYQHHYDFTDNFERVEINPDAEIPEGLTFEECLAQSLELSITGSNARVLIIDNLTYLRSETEKASDALPLMKELKWLKNKYGLSILALAHTPKRDQSKPLERNDLQGSKMLANHCDTSFAIGESQTDKNLRYIKQIKVRNTPFIYHSENVCLCQIHKEYNFLQFELLGHSSEREHLKVYTSEADDAMRKKAMELKKEGMSFRQIGAQLGISHTKARRLTNDGN